MSDISHITVGDETYDIKDSSALKTVSTTGSGNAITGASVSGTGITLTKGETFLTEHQDLSEYRTASAQDVIDATKVSDVQINSSSVVSEGIANIPIADWTHLGLVKTDNSSGGYTTGLINLNGTLYLKNPANLEITNRGTRIPILANNLDFAIKSALCDGKGAAYTTAEQSAALERLDAQKTLVSGTNIKTVNGVSLLGSGDIPISGGGSGTITGVSVNGTSVATSGVANITNIPGSIITGDISNAGDITSSNSIYAKNLFLSSLSESSATIGSLIIYSSANGNGMLDTNLSKYILSYDNTSQRYKFDGDILNNYTLLWQNESPGSAFASQTITPSGYLNYNFIYITLYSNGGNTAGGFIIHRDGTTVRTSIPRTYSGNYVHYWRPVTFSDNGITFGEGNRDGAATNSAMVPWQIYGIK